MSGGQASRPVLSEEQAQAKVTVTVTMIGASPVTKSTSIGGKAVTLVWNDKVVEVIPSRRQMTTT